MGYFLTSQPENAVPVFAPCTGLRRGKPEKSWVPPKTHTPGSRLEKRGARFYSAILSRWVSRDPLRLKRAGSFNPLDEPRDYIFLYWFVWNDPISYWDVLGLFGDGHHGKARDSEDPNKQEWYGHSDFPGHEAFDWTAEDHGFWSSPFNLFTGTWRHFQDLPVSEKQARDAIAKCDTSSFERAGHRVQDYYTHYNKGYRYDPKNGKYGHPAKAEDGYSPDEDNPAWSEAAKETQMLLDEWNAHCCKCGQVWNVRATGPCSSK